MQCLYYTSFSVFFCVQQIRQESQEKEVKGGQGERKCALCANHCVHGKQFCGLGRSLQVSKNKTQSQ